MCETIPDAAGGERFLQGTNKLGVVFLNPGSFLNTELLESTERTQVHAATARRESKTFL